MWAPLPPDVLELLCGDSRPIDGEEWDAVFREIDGFRGLTDDYDGQGAKAPTAGVFDGAIGLIRGLVRAGVPGPTYVVAGPNGSLNLEWEYADRVSVAVEVTESDEADVFLLAPGREPGYWVLTQTAAV